MLNSFAEISFQLVYYFFYIFSDINYIQKVNKSSLAFSLYWIEHDYLINIILSFRNKLYSIY